MQVQVNSDHKIEGSEAQNAWVTEVVDDALSHVSAHVTRVEVHLKVEAGGKDSPSEFRCMMEARLEARQPVAVTQSAPGLDLAVREAAHKLARLLEHTLAKSHDSHDI
jgi:hypothetical protein